MTSESKPKRSVGRPPVKAWPEPIDASPEKIAEVVLRAKPKKVWRYEQEEAARKARQSQ